MLLVAATLLVAIPLPQGFCRALSMPFRFSRPPHRPVVPARSSRRRRAAFKEHDWEDTVLRNLTMASEVRDSDVF